MVQKWRRYEVHLASKDLRWADIAEIARKTKNLRFGSLRRVASNARGDVRVVVVWERAVL